LSSITRLETLPALAGTFGKCQTRSVTNQFVHPVSSRSEIHIDELWDTVTTTVADTIEEKYCNPEQFNRQQYQPTVFVQKFAHRIHDRQ
jgi:hypothetical protein